MIHHEDVTFERDEEFICAFEDTTLPEECFRHRDHIRLAWLYLRRYSVPHVLELYTQGIKNFARANGSETLYHETITWAYIFLVKERMETADGNEHWEDFASKNPDLMSWQDSVLNRYYPKEVLFSDLAKKTFLLPETVSKSVVSVD